MRQWLAALALAAVLAVTGCQGEGPGPEAGGRGAPAPQFKWYANSVPPGVREGDRAMDRGSLLAYLRQRQASHERLEVTWFHGPGDPVAYGLGHFGMKLRRTADDLPGGPQPLAGKGAVDCDTHKLVVLAIGEAY